MATIYVLNYEESEIIGYRIFDDFIVALKEYLSHCISETKSVLDQQEDEDYDITNCSLQIQKLKDHEYVSDKEYEYEQFEDLIGSKDDIEEYLSALEKTIKEDRLNNDSEIGKEILLLFQC